VSSIEERYQEMFQRSENARGISLREGERERESVCVCVYDDRMAPREPLVVAERDETERDENVGEKRDAKPVALGPARWDSRGLPFLRPHGARAGL